MLLNKNQVLTSLFLLVAGCIQAQQKSMLFRNGVVHTGTGTVYETGILGIRDGKIALCADGRAVKIDPTAWDTMIDLGGRHVYPGFIALNSTIGLREIDAVRATLDYAEVGEYNPHVRSLPAFNTDSRIIPTVRSNGVFMVQAVPQKGVISGSSSVFKLDGWNWEDAVLKADEGIHLFWPEFPVFRSDTGRFDGTLRKQQEILNFLREARAYHERPAGEKNLRFEAMKGIWSGKQRLYIHCNRARDIEDAINAMKQLKIANLAVVGGRESYKVSDLLLKHNVPVVLERIHRLPDNEDQAVDFPFRLPGILEKAGITVVLTYDGDMEAMGTRNLGFTAGTASAYGCDEEQALRMITLNAATVLGINQQTGSLETGKSADFFISEGNALDMRSSRVIMAFMGGNSVGLDNDQKALYRKYMQKYGLKPKD